MAQIEETEIRLLRPDDIEFACSVVELAGWNQLPADWSRLMTAEPEGCFLIECDGSPAGTATTTSYGQDLGWIGMVLVHPDFRRRGLATALLKRCLSYLLDEKKVACVKLDATPDGMKVYEKLGFEAEYELARWSGGGSVEISSGAAAPALNSVLELDKNAFGTNRSDYLNLLAVNSDQVAVAKGGYGFARPGRVARYLGPVVSESPETARQLVSDLLHLEKESTVYWDIPEDNLEAVSLAGSLGFERQRKLIRMWTGSQNSRSRPDLQWAIAGPETG